MNNVIREQLDYLLSVDDPNNYDDADSACESMTDEFDNLTVDEHYEICQIVEEWFVRGVDDDTQIEEEECDE